MIKEGFNFFKKIIFRFFFDPICRSVSYTHFPIIFSVFSIILIVCRLCAQYVNSLMFLKFYLDIFVYFTLIFSLFGLFYQTQRIDLIIYPPKVTLIDRGEYYGVKDLKKEEEREIEFLFSKEGFFKITLDSRTINFPEIGELKIIQTSFYNDNIGITRNFIENVENGQMKIINQEIQGFAGFICSFKIFNKDKVFPMTTYEIKIKISYRVLGFQMYKEKKVIINP